MLTLTHLEALSSSQCNLRPPLREGCRCNREDELTDDGHLFQTQLPLCRAPSPHHICWQQVYFHIWLDKTASSPKWFGWSLYFHQLTCIAKTDIWDKASTQETTALSVNKTNWTSLTIKMFYALIDVTCECLAIV